MRTWASVERHHLCELAADLGPDAPTLCAGWTVDDLMTHLCVRERSPLGAAGILAPPFAVFTERATKKLGARSFEERVEMVAAGGLFGTEGTIAEAFGLLEFTIHCQDIERAGDPNWIAAQRSREFALAIFNQLRFVRSTLGRNIPSRAGLILHDPAVGTVDVRRGPVVTTVEGPAVELAMWAFGRHRHAAVTLHTPNTHPHLGNELSELVGL